MQFLLPKNALFRIDGDARGLTLRCVKGALWITQPDDRVDHVLRQDMQFTIDREGRIAVWAVADAAFDFRESAAAPDASLFRLAFRPLPGEPARSTCSRPAHLTAPVRLAFQKG